MKKTLTTLLILSTAGLMSAGLISCRKDKEEPSIKEFDQEQIENYIKANNLTEMKKDTSGGDTTGIYYQILRPGIGKPLDYSDEIFFVYTIKSLDGKFQQTDTITNHAYNWVGHLPPKGLLLGIKNAMKVNGTQARLLIPSHLAYGTNGISSSDLKGNQGLDYYVNIIDPSKQDQYDDMVMQNYMSANGLTGYTKTTVDNSPMYYKVTQAGTGTNKVTEESQVGIQYSGYLMNGTLFDQFNPSDTTFINYDVQLVPKGWKEGFQHVTKGAKLSIIIPSKLGYGVAPPTGFTNATLPSNSCLRYEFNIMSIIR